MIFSNSQITSNIIFTHKIHVIIIFLKYQISNNSQNSYYYYIFKLQTIIFNIFTKLVYHNIFKLPGNKQYYIYSQSSHYYISKHRQQYQIYPQSSYHKHIYS